MNVLFNFWDFSLEKIVLSRFFVISIFWFSMKDIHFVNDQNILSNENNVNYS